MSLISDQQRAGHLLRIKAPKLAEAAVTEQYRLQPDLAGRYGPRGRQYCVRDVRFHVEFLAASVELGDPARFASYVRWARDVMAAHGIPPADFQPGLHALRRTIVTLLPAGTAETAARHVDAALEAWEGAAR